MSHCSLKALGNPGLNGIATGLNFSEGRLEFNLDMFPCCEGSSRRLDEKTDSIISCDLIKRHKNTEKIYLNYFRTWSKQATKLPHEVSAVRSSDVLKKSANMIKGVDSQATVLKGVNSGPSILWSYAIALSWRFNHRVHLYTIGKSAQQDILPKENNDDRPLVILVENVHKLWDSKNKEDLELLIQYAYNSNANLLIEVKEFHKNPSLTEAGPKVSSFINNKINNMKTRPYWEFLSEDSISRLKTMCYLPKQIF